MYMNNFTKITVIYGKIFDEILKSDYIQTKKEREDEFIENAKSLEKMLKFCLSKPSTPSS